ncbi:SRPBCC family protein [Microbulbifer sp. SSSA002]|uniref:SRPBCC family protein n=1 Tax=Microbulbifer sp. SSSA002 TaxID=3243376 RepID=UPI004039BA42
MILDVICAAVILYVLLCLLLYVKDKSYSYQNAVTIQVSSEDLFDFVVDLRNWESKYPNTLFAEYNMGGNKATVGSVAIEKYWGITGYHVMKHQLVNYERPNKIAWEGRIIYGGALVLLCLPITRYVSGHFSYTITEEAGGASRWERCCYFKMHSTNPFYLLVYLLYMPLFRLELLKALRLYQAEVKEMMEKIYMN